MSDSNKEQPAITPGRAKSIEAGQATKSGQPGGPVLPATPVARRSRWRAVSSIILMLLGAIGIVVYLAGPKIAERYEGVGAALCAVACGGFLVWHAIHLFAEEDKLQDEMLKANQWPISPSEENLDEQQADPTKSPRDAGQDVK